MHKQLIQIEGASLPFYRFQEGSDTIIEFDSTGCGCPIPMVNAMAGLQRAAASGEILHMINGFEPVGLYARIEGYFNWSVRLESGKQVRICFTPVLGRAGELDFGNNQCHGGND
jgi:hypothetical protein